MSIRKCLAEAVSGGELSKAEADALNDAYEGYREARAGAGEADAKAGAKADLAGQLRAEAADKKRRVALAAAAAAELEDNIASYRTATGRQDIAEGSISVLEHYGGGTSYSSVEGRRKAVLGQSHATMSDVLQDFERTVLTGSTPQTARLENVVRELLGEPTADTAAAALAKAWTETAEWLRQRFNRAGGAIGKLTHWGLPQWHDARALVAAGLDTWKAAIRPLLDPSRMVDGITGKPILARDLDRILDNVWDSIVTDGWDEREPKHQPFGLGALATRRADHRFLVFRDADSWLAYQRDFGQGDPFAAMMGHINGMSRDIAALEILGPNPQAMLEWLKQTVTKEAALARAGKPSRILGGKRADSRARQTNARIDAMWDDMRGAANSTVNSTWAHWGAGLRNWSTASVMGSAIVSAVPTDPVYQSIARAMIGLPVISTVRDIAASFSGAARHEAVRAGLILDSAMHTFSTQARYVGTLSGPEWTRVLADRVLTYSGLTAWTQAAKHAFGLAFTGELADRAGLAMADLDPRLARTMQAYGIDAATWDKIRSAKHFEPETGATFLRPDEVRAVDGAAADRLLEMILSETEYAVPTGSVRGRSYITQAGRPGTIWGEFARSAGMFRSFGVTFLMLYGARIWRETVASPARGAAYAAALATTATLGGTLAVWLKDVVNGRDPRPIDKHPLRFFAAAAAQGGGFGIFGDFLFADVNRFGSGLGSTLSGPLIGNILDPLYSLTQGNAMQLAAGEKTNFFEEARKFAARNTPGSSLWYLRLAYQRVLLDQLQYLTDPRANQAFKRRQADFAKSYGGTFFWRQGQTLPDRAPRF